MKYLHTMVRISDPATALAFYCDGLRMVETRRVDSEQGRFTLIFLAAPADKARADAEKAPLLELTYNWDPEAYSGGRNFGHLAFEVDDIYETCAHLQGKGIMIARPPRDGRMAFIRSPDGISVELLQKGAALAHAEPWLSMGNTGTW
jgi:lactoylglutathione lyase